MSERCNLDEGICSECPMQMIPKQQLDIWINTVMTAEEQVHQLGLAALTPLSWYKLAEEDGEGLEINRAARECLERQLKAERP